MGTQGNVIKNVVLEIHRAADDQAAGKCQNDIDIEVVAVADRRPLHLEIIDGEGSKVGVLHLDGDAADLKTAILDRQSIRIEKRLGRVGRVGVRAEFQVNGKGIEVSFKIAVDDNLIPCCPFDA